MQDTQIRREFFRYTSQNIMGMIGLSCYILADTYFISQGLGADGLTALNLAIPFYNFIQGIGLMLGMGGATRFSILRGQDMEEEAMGVFTQSLMLALCAPAECPLGRQRSGAWNDGHLSESAALLCPGFFAEQRSAVLCEK